MSHRVMWERECFESIEAILDAGESAEQIVDSIQRIERGLAMAPATNSVHLSEGLYRFDARPLRAYFEIDELAGEVKVFNLHWYRQA